MDKSVEADSNVQQQVWIKPATSSTNIENSMSGTHNFTYQRKLLTCGAWKLACKFLKKDCWLEKLKIYHEREFLPVKQRTACRINGKLVQYDCYSFVHAIHVTDFNSKISIDDLSVGSPNKRDNQFSLIDLFKSYLNMLEHFGNQINSLIIFTNRDLDIDTFPCKVFVPVEANGIFHFANKGKQYKIDVNMFRHLYVMVYLQSVIQTDRNANAIKEKLNQTEDDIVMNFLKKLTFMVSQPTERELENLIVEEMRTMYSFPEILYNDLYKTVIDGKLQHFTEHLVQKHLNAVYEKLIENLKTAMHTCTSSEELAKKLTNELKVSSNQK